jgi:hypothetical protein
MFTAHSLRSFKAQSTQRTLSFSFIPKAFGINENHPKLRFIWFVSQDASISIESIIGWIPDTAGLLITLPEGLEFISFRPLSERK